MPSLPSITFSLFLSQPSLPAGLSLIREVSVHTQPVAAPGYHSLPQDKLLAFQHNPKCRITSHQKLEIALHHRIAF